MLKPVFYTRANALNTFQATWLKVNAATWAALGGCDTAKLSGWNLGRLDLAAALGLLRCGVELEDEAGEPCWWGYVNGVQLCQGHMGAACSLEQMSNRVRVSYMDPDHRIMTTWAENADSERTYGTKEKIVPWRESTNTQAETIRTIELSENGWPCARPVVKEPSKTGDIQLELKGWWRTTSWRYYDHMTQLLETTAQIALMAGSGYGGQFLNGVRIEQASGLYTDALRIGEQTAMAEMARQLAGGDALGRRLSCEVTRDRHLRIYSTPAASTAAMRISQAGNLVDLLGNTLPAWKARAGQWAILESPWLGGGSQYQQISDRVYLAGLEYDPESGSIRPK